MFLKKSNYTNLYQVFKKYSLTLKADSYFKLKTKSIDSNKICSLNRLTVPYKWHMEYPQELTALKIQKKVSDHNLCLI